MKITKKFGLVSVACLLASFAIAQNDRPTYLPVDVPLASSNKVGSMTIANDVAPNTIVQDLDFYDSEFKMRTLDIDAALKLGLSSVDLGGKVRYVTIVADYMRFKTVPVLITIGSDEIYAVANVGVDCRLQFVTTAAAANLAVNSGAVGVNVSIKYFSETLSLGAYGFKNFEQFSIPTDNKGVIQSGKLKSVLIGVFNKLMAQSGPFRPKLIGFNLTGAQSKKITEALAAGTTVTVTKA